MDGDKNVNQPLAEPFRARAEELASWLASAGQFPNRRSADEHERGLAGWRTQQLRKARAGVLPPEFQECLDAVAPRVASGSGRA